MRNHVWIFCVGAALFAAPATAALASTTGTVLSVTSTTSAAGLPDFQSAPKYCLFFTVDGLDRDYVTPEHTPNIYTWAETGVRMPDSINVYPTLTTPNMTSILTGAYPLTTTIGSNQVFLKDEKRVVGGPRFNKAETIAESFKSGGHSTAAVQHFMLENRGADRYHHTGTKYSTDITSTALGFLSDPQNIPALLTVLYQSVDAAGHEHGQNTTGVLAEARHVDAEMAKIVERYRELGLLEETLIVISSDHGMSSTEQPIDRKALNEAITGGGWTYQILMPRMQPSADVDLHVLVMGNLQVYFNREFAPEEQERLFETLSKVEGVGRIFDSMALRRMGAHPNAGDVIVEPANGWWLGGKGGTHARNRESDAFQTILGAGAKSGTSIQGARSIDLMPTVLKAFGLPIPATVDGRPLTEALR